MRNGSGPGGGRCKCVQGEPRSLFSEGGYGDARQLTPLVCVVLLCMVQLGTHSRGKAKREELQGVLQAQRKAAAARKD